MAVGAKRHKEVTTGGMKNHEEMTDVEIKSTRRLRR
jgi:hypothetical protein